MKFNGTGLEAAEGSLADNLADFLTRFKAELYRAAEEPQDMPPLTEELFGLYEQTGSRLEYERVYFTRRRRLALTGLQALLELETDGAVPPDRLQTLCSIIEDICNETCWALPAHVDRGADPDWRLTVDLFAAETAQTLAELCDRLGKLLPEQLRVLITEQVERRVLVPFFRSPVPYGTWEGAEHNWNAVCAGSIGSVCLHLMQEQPQRLERSLARVCASLRHYIDGFSADGVCLEGVGYYTYGMTYFVHFALELEQYTGGRTDLLRGSWDGLDGGSDDRRVSIAHFFPKCFFPDGKSVSFSDCTSEETFRVGLSCALAMHCPGLEFPGLDRAAGVHSDRCYRFAALEMDLFCTERFLRSGMGEPSLAAPAAGRAFLFPDAQWCICHSAGGIGFACKGGHNGVPHNHNDAGHFIYEGGGALFFTDLGLGDYNRDYFGPARYEILCNSSLGHSVPIIDGQGQGAGAGYRCGAFSAQEDGTVEMELSAAYPAGLLERFDRSFRFHLESGELTVHDLLRPAQGGAEVVENLVTQIFSVVSGGGVLLEADGRRCVLEVEAPGMPEFCVQAREHRDHQGQARPVYTIQWKVPVTDGVAECRFRLTQRD